MTEEDDGFVSRSRRRREVREDFDLRKKLLEAVVALPPELTSNLQIDRALQDDLEQLRHMRNSGARQRLLRRLSRRTEDTDWSVLENLVAQASQLKDREVRKEKKLVAWRDRLVDEGTEALDPAFVRFPNADRQQLRQLVLRARRNPGSAEAKGSGKRLLRLLRELDQEVQ